jgi:hypothetical protein
VAGLEKDRSRAHIPRMEKQRSRMLDVTVTHDPPRWEWSVTSKGESLANGIERDKSEASFAGYSAMFLLLASGWNP